MSEGLTIVILGVGGVFAVLLTLMAVMSLAGRFAQRAVHRAHGDGETTWDTTR